MSRISKWTAQQMAVSMVEDKSDEINKLRDNLSEFVENEFLKTVPKDLSKLSSEALKYVYKTNYYALRDGGKYLVGIATKNSFPTFKDKDLDSKVKSKAIKMFYEIEDKVGVMKKLSSDIEHAIYNLKTPKKLQEHFPEAVKHLPDDKKPNPLVVDVSSIMKRL